jgi:hypothetical protein
MTGKALSQGAKIDQAPDTLTDAANFNHQKQATLSLMSRGQSFAPPTGDPFPPWE